MANKVTEAGVYGWTKTGAKVWVEHCFDNGERLVRSVLESIYDYDGDEQEVLGELRIVDSVWDAEPVEVYGKRVKELQQSIAGLESELKAIRESWALENKKQDEQRKRYAAIPELRQLDQFIAGKITHYVGSSRWQSPRIVAFAETVGDKYERGLKAMKMLTLFGKSDGKLEWCLNEYKDGSGSDYEVIPCCSLEEAQAVLQVEFYKRFDGSASETLLKDAETAGVVIPDDFRERVRAAKIASARKTVKELSVKLIEANSKLLEVQGD